VLPPCRLVDEPGSGHSIIYTEAKLKPAGS